MAVTLNRAFRGWGHRFLWNEPALRTALEAAGFGEMRSAPRGKSDLACFQEIERHEAHPDLEGLPHLLILEARSDVRDPARYAEVRSYLESEFASHLESVVERPLGR